MNRQSLESIKQKIIVIKALKIVSIDLKRKHQNLWHLFNKTH